MNSTIIPQTKSMPSNSLKSPIPLSRALNLNPNPKAKTVPTNSKIPNLSNYLHLRRQEKTANSSYGVVFPRLRGLVSEFRSLPEPIDRVKKLLDYASALPRLGESARSPENRVAGCASQVWLEADLDALRRMRFRADSDSEITKGFSSCLIYLLDGASPEEVLMVKAEDLADMNVGLVARSRVNSWHNVLTAMQDRTKSLMLKTGGINPPLNPLSSLLYRPD